MASSRRATAGRVLRVSAVLAVGLVLATAVSVAVGPTPLHLFERETWTPGSDAWRKLTLLRIPRAIAAAIVGSCLAAAGTLYQALIHNPLASPYILGVSSGASLGAILALALGLGAAMTTPLAFAGAILAMALVAGIARSAGRTPSDTLLLSGVVVNAFLGAVILFLMILLERDYQARMLHWLVGRLHDSYGTAELLSASGLLVLGFASAFLLSRELNAIAGSDAAALRLGVAVERVRLAVFLVASLLTATAVSLAGPIGFVGLIVPHVLRLIVGFDHRVLLPAAVLAGGAFLTLVDTAAEVALAIEVPAGVLTAFLGGPFFLYLLRRRDRAGAGCGA